MGDSNKVMVENGFDLHDRATTASRVGRVRQTISKDELISEVDLEVGVLPGFPLRVKGTVVTTASLTVVSAETFELQIQGTHVRGSNLPVLNQFLDDPSFDLPMKDIYQTIQGTVPVVPIKTFYGKFSTYTFNFVFPMVSFLTATLSHSYSYLQLTKLCASLETLTKIFSYLQEPNPNN